VLTNWVALSLIYVVLGALVNVFNGHYLSRRMPDVYSYLFIIGIPSLIAGVVLLSIFPFPADIEITTLLLALAAAILRTTGAIMMYYMTKHEEITRVSSLGSVGPIFVAILAVIFLGSDITLLQFMAIIIVVIGLVLLSIKFYEKQPFRFLYKRSLFVLAACLLISIATVIDKYTLTYLSFWNNSGILFTVFSVTFIIFSLRQSSIKNIFNFNNRLPVIAGITGNQVLTLLTLIIFYQAVQSGPVASVSTIAAIKPVVIFVASTVLGFLVPGFLLDEVSIKKNLLLKLLAVVLIVGGLIILIQNN